MSRIFIPNQLYEDDRIPKGIFKGNRGHIVDSKNLQFLGNGCNASVWKYESSDSAYAFKYFFPKNRVNSLEKSTYERMSDISLNYITKAVELCRSCSDSDFFMDGYLMTLLSEDKNLSLLEQPIDLFFENVKGLETDCLNLSKHHICMQDVKIENTLFHRDDGKFYMTDVDLFTVIDDASFFELEKFNTGLLKALYMVELIKEIDSLSELYLDEQASYKVEVYDMLSAMATEGISIVSIFEDVFSKYNKPKEYFLKK